MAKYLISKVSRHRWWPFLLGMLIYAVVVAVAGFFGLRYLWQYMTAYEASRPANTLNAYMDELTVEDVCSGVQGLVDGIDHNLQSEEECFAYIKDFLKEEITCAKKSAECTDTKQVFVLRSGKHVIGQMVMTASAPDKYGFTVWSVTDETFNLDYLLGQPVSVTVPDVLQVHAGETVLDEAYITEHDIGYQELEDFYGKYELPNQVTYTAGPILGDLELRVTDSEGTPVELDENTDMAQYFQNCNPQEISQLEQFVEKFVGRYVTFTGSANRNREANFANLITCVVEKTDLAQRLRDAIEGLHYAQSRSDKVVSITSHYLVRLEDGRYLCNFTYEVDTVGTKGTVRTSTNMQLIVVEHDGVLKAESMNIY